MEPVVFVLFEEHDFSLSIIARISLTEGRRASERTEKGYPERDGQCFEG